MPSSVLRAGAAPRVLVVATAGDRVALDPGAVAALWSHLARQGDDLVRVCREIAGDRGARRAEALRTLMERAAASDHDAGRLLVYQIARLRDLLDPEGVGARGCAAAPGDEAGDPLVLCRCLHAAALGRVLQGDRASPPRPLARSPAGGFVKVPAGLLDAGAGSCGPREAPGPPPGAGRLTRLHPVAAPRGDPA